MEPSLLICSWQKEFRTAWQNGTPLNLTEFISRCLADLPQGCDSEEFIIEVLSIDLDFQWAQSSSNRKTVNDYVAQLPPGMLNETARRALLIEEFRLRRAAGDGPVLEDYRHQLRELQASAQEINDLERLTSRAGDAVRSMTTPIDITPKLSRYILHESIGSGGMGTVFRATHRASRAEVAVKILTSQIPELVQRFVAEAEAAMKLSHPNIVRVMDVDQEDGLYFMSMEFLRGGNLEELVADGKTLAPVEAARTLIPIAQAIDLAHRRSIIHRDIKPSNILIDEQNTLKISDFGLAKQFRIDNNEDSPHTQLGQVLGTPEYMSPEQAIGDNRNVKRHADIYSLGAVLYRLVVGRPPFKGADPLDTVALVRGGSVVLPREFVPSIPPDLEAIILQCLQYDPRDRYYSAEALADDLENFVKGEQVRARVAYRTKKRQKISTKRLIQILAVAVSVAIAIGLLIYPRAPAANIAELERKLERAYTENAKQQQLDYQHQLHVEETKRYAAQLQHAYQLVCSGDRRTARTLLQNMPQQFDDWPQIAGREWDWLDGICRQEHANRITQLGRLRHVSTTSNFAKRIWVGGDSLESDRLLSFDLALGAQLAESIALHPDFHGVSSIAFCPYSKTLAVTGFSPKILILGLKDQGGVKSQLGVAIDPPDSVNSTPINGRISCLAFSDNGSRLWIGDTYGNVIALRAPYREQPKKIAQLRSQIMTIAVSRNGLLLAGASNGEIIRIEPNDSVRPLTSRDKSAQLRSIELSPNGRLLALATSKGLGLLSLTEPVEEFRPAMSFELSRSCNCVTWTPEGTFLVVGTHDGYLRVFDSDTFQSCGQVLAHKSSVDRLLAVEDQIISTAEDGSIFSCRLDTVLLAYKNRSINDPQERLTDSQATCPETFKIPENSIQKACVPIDDRRALIWLSKVSDSVGIWDRITGLPLLELKLPFENPKAISWDDINERCVITDTANRQWLFNISNTQK